MKDSIRAEIRESEKPFMERLLQGDLAFEEHTPPELRRLLGGAKYLDTEAFFDYIIEEKSTQPIVGRQIREVVPIAEWITDEYYLGDEASTLWPFWRDVIVEFCESGKNELILTGSIRSGKSTAAYILTLRKIYELSCFSPIPAYFGLSTSSLVLFMYLSLTIRQAMRLGLGRIRRMMDKIGYFSDNFPRNTNISGELRFLDPNLIMIGGSELGHFKGSDLYYLIFDEANFTKAGIDARFQTAVDIYREATIRRKSTFMLDGEEQGVAVIISSAETQSSFVEKHIEEVRADPGVMIVEAVQYQVRPEKYAGIERFWVFVGDDVLDAFIVDEDEAGLKNYCRVREVEYYNFEVEKLSGEERVLFRDVPETFREVFRKDIYGALKEVCGVAVGAYGRFFTNRVAFTRAFPKIEPPVQHPFYTESVTCSYMDEARIEDSFDEEKFKFTPGAEYFGGIDQSLSDDTTGLVLAHLDSYDLKQGRFHLVYDIILQILPPRKPARISPDKVADFFIYLKRKYSIHNFSVSMDWYATQATLQKFIRAGINASIHSVDRNWEDYRNFAGSLLDGRISGYHYDPLREEFFSLVQDNERRKVDHPGGGRKDVSDGVVQAHQSAFKSFDEIVGGIRFFPNFGTESLQDIRLEEVEPFAEKTVVGVYFGPEMFYAVWVMVGRRREKEYSDSWDYGIKKRGEGSKGDTKRLFVVEEWADFSKPTRERVAYIKDRSVRYGGDIIYAADPISGLGKGIDLSQSSPVREFRRLGVPFRCRRRLDPENFEVITRSIKEESNSRLVINELGCPYLISGIRGAKRATISGGLVKTSKMDKTGREFPIIALRVALEEATLRGRAESI